MPHNSSLPIIQNGADLRTSVIKNRLSDFCVGVCVGKMDWYGGKWWYSNLIPKFTKKLEFSWNSWTIVFRIKNSAFIQNLGPWIHPRVEKSHSTPWNYRLGQVPFKMFFFSKIVGAIVISVQRSSGHPNFIQIRSIFLVFSYLEVQLFLKLGTMEFAKFTICSFERWLPWYKQFLKIFILKVTSPSL